MESELLRRRVKSTSYEPQIAIKIANIGSGLSWLSVLSDLILVQDLDWRWLNHDLTSLGFQEVWRSLVKNLDHQIWFFLLNKFWSLLWWLGDGWHRNTTIMIWANSGIIININKHQNHNKNRKNRKNQMIFENSYFFLAISSKMRCQLGTYVFEWDLGGQN